LIENLTWFSQPGVVSVFTPSLGTVHECNASAAVTIIRNGDFIDSTTRYFILYNRAGSSILFDGENISFDASLVILVDINSINIPPIMIMNMMYGNQNLLHIVPLMRHTIVVCNSNISPMAIGCFISVNINIVIVLNDISTFVTSGVILFKMLVLGINEMVCAFPLKF
jgi:hypothetical protein